MARFGDEDEAWVSSITKSPYYPLVDVKVASGGQDEDDDLGGGGDGETWAPAHITTWRKPAGSDASEAMVLFVGFEDGGVQAAHRDEVRALSVPELEPGTAVIDGVADLKIGSKVRAVYLVDRCWYEGTVVAAFGKRHFATVLFDEYDETQNTAWPLIAKVVDAAQASSAAGDAAAKQQPMAAHGDDDDADEVGSTVSSSTTTTTTTTTTRGGTPTPGHRTVACLELDEERVQYYVGLARAGVPLAAAEAAARNDGVPDGLVRRRVEEARRSGAPPTKPPGHNPRAVVAELEASQCFEDAFLRRVFEQYDVRAPKGQLTPMDFVDALKKASSDLAKSALELFVAFDGDENGGLDFDEFKTGVRRLVLERDDDGVKALVWYWRSQQEEWFVGTGRAAAMPAETTAPRVARPRRGAKARSSVSVGTMALGGKPREISRPCVVRLDRQTVTIWKLASTAEANRTTEMPPLSTARFHGTVLDAYVVDSRAKRATSRCDAVVTVAPASGYATVSPSHGDDAPSSPADVKLWLPRTAAERARWITDLYQAAAVTRSKHNDSPDATPAGRTAGSRELGVEAKNGSAHDTEYEEEAEEEESPEAVAQRFLEVPDEDPTAPPNELRVVVWRGLNLVARDHSILGGQGTSDPYVRIYEAGNPGAWRATRVVHKSLNPAWVQTFTLPYDATTARRGRQHNAPCRVVFVCSDHDRASRDDFMGSLAVAAADPAERGLLADSEWIDLTSAVPDDPLTKELADTSKKNAATVSGALQVSVLLRRAVTLFDDPGVFEPDEPAVLLVGVHSASLKTAKKSANPRLCAKLLGFQGAAVQAPTSTRRKTTEPQWVEILRLDPPETPTASKVADRVLELVVEDVEPYSTKTKVLGVAHVSLGDSGDQGFTLRKVYDLRPPVGDRRGAKASAPVGTVDVVVYYRPLAFADTDA